MKKMKKKRRRRSRKTVIITHDKCLLTDTAYSSDKCYIIKQEAQKMLKHKECTRGIGYSDSGM